MLKYIFCLDTSLPEDVQISSMSARGFYIITYTLSFIALGYYDNQLLEAIHDYHITYLVLYFSLLISSTILFFTAGTNCGYLRDYPTEDLVQGKEYQTGYFVNGRHVVDRDSIEAAVEEHKQESDAVFEVAKESNDSQIGVHTQGDEETEERVSEVELKSRITGIEHISPFEIPPKRYCEECKVTQPYRTKHCRDCKTCVRKYDHHCFWIGGCVGELNHRKFFAFLVIKTFSLVMSFDIAVSGYDRAVKIDELKQQFHVKAIFIFLICLTVMFIFFTAILLFYHSFLLMTNQTTWEHSKKTSISYLKVYPRTVFPFDYGIWNNLKMTLWHGNKTREWTLRHPDLLRTREGFNYFENEYYNCC